MIKECDCSFNRRSLHGNLSWGGGLLLDRVNPLLEENVECFGLVVESMVAGIQDLAVGHLLDRLRVANCNSFDHNILNIIKPTSSLAFLKASLSTKASSFSIQYLAALA